MLYDRLHGQSIGMGTGNVGGEDVVQIMQEGTKLRKGITFIGSWKKNRYRVR